MNPILQFFLKALMSTGGFLITIMITSLRQLCVVGGCRGFDSIWGERLSLHIKRRSNYF